jgi:aspartate 1-decarboxylase
VIGLNGAAARKGYVVDLFIIVSYAQYDESELADFEPIILLCDERNRIRQRLNI